MSAPAPANPLPTADAALTADRDERKYFIALTSAPVFARTLARQLVVHRYSGPGANPLPHAQHFTTTVYFDTASQLLRREALADPTLNVKLRSREYYDLHPALAEVAVDPSQIVHYRPSMWLELKSKRGARTQKARVQLDKPEVPGFFSGDHPAWRAPKLAGDEDPAVVIASFCRQLAEPLSASCLVNYRRLAFQDPAGRLRVTLDLDLAFYAPPEDLWTRRRALVRDTLGPVCGQPRIAVVEVKGSAGAPAWLDAALAEADARSTGYSKFLAGAEAVHGGL